MNIKDVNYEIIQNSLKSQGFEIEFKGRNDLVIRNKKFSGSAYEVDLNTKEKHTRVLHHGTLLIDVDLESMVDYLNPNVLKLKSKVN